MFLDVGIHSIDISSWIAGEYPIEISAMAHASKEMYVKQGDVDAFGVMMKFPSGLVAYTDSCRYAPYGYDQRLEVEKLSRKFIIFGRKQYFQYLNLHRY